MKIVVMQWCWYRSWIHEYMYTEQLVNMYVINIKSRAYVKYTWSIVGLSMHRVVCWFTIILTLFIASIFASLLSSSWTTAKWPWRLATRSGVSPSFEEKVYEISFLMINIVDDDNDKNSILYCIINLCLNWCIILINLSSSYSSTSYHNDVFVVCSTCTSNI